MNVKLTPIQAYQAMFFFLEGFYSREGNSDEIGLLLSMMQLLGDNKPADPAMWNDWIMAVKRVLAAE